MGTVTYVGTATAGIILQYQLDANNHQIINLADGVLPTDAVNKQQLDSLILEFEWQESVLDKDTTSPPVGPANGDRYLIGTDTTAGVAAGAWAGHDGEIAEWNGVAWVFYNPTVGSYVGVDDETTRIYLFGGVTWAAKDFENTTASTGLTKVVNDIRLDSSAAGDGLGFLAGVLNVNVDNATLETNADALRIRDLGVVKSKLNTTTVGSAVVTNLIAGADISISQTGVDTGTGAVTINSTITASGGLTKTLSDIALDAGSAGAGLTLGAGVYSVNVDDSTIEINADTLRVKDAGITRQKLNTATVGSACVTRLVAGTNVSFVSTGADTGTGEVTINATDTDTGEVNTASNVNAGGVGVFKQKTGVNLEFRGINAGSGNITVTLDNPNNEVDVDLNPDLDINSIMITS